MSNKRPILIGSIIHLRNLLEAKKSAHEGYLNILKRVEDAPHIQMWPDPNVRAFVATHKLEHGANGSGSWQVLSADGMKRTGEVLTVGDKIHLLNLQSGAGYLDSFEWVDRFQAGGKAAFPGYPMQIGVFTSNAERGKGVSGTWTVHGATEKNLGDTLVEGDLIELANHYPGAGSLYGYGIDGGVTNHQAFKGKQVYEEQRLFVFTGPESPKWQQTATEVASKRWQVTLSTPPEYLYRISDQRDHEGVPLSDGGLFKIVDNPNQLVTKLRITSDDLGQTLSGTICFDGEEQPTSHNFHATHQHLDPNDYLVTIDNVPSSDRWRLGARDAQRVVAMKIDIDRNHGTLQGELIYAGEEPIKIAGQLEIRTSDDLPQPGWVKGRTRRVESAIAENHNLLVTYLKSIGAISAYRSFTAFDRFMPNRSDLTKLVNIPATFDPLDREFQVEQLLNLNSLSQLLNSFFRYTLHTLMLHSLEKHKQATDGTLAPLHLFRQCFQQVAIDHEIINKAIVQRQWDLARYSMGKQAEELLKLDKLAIKAITPFRKLLVSDKNTTHALAVITYLSEKTHIHRVPYTKQFILIGVSYDRVPPAASIFDQEEFLGKDFYAYEIMAIPHEVGHYLYQQGRLDGQTFPALSKQFAENPYYRWCEELFADVYSCIVAGPLAAISMQALLMSIDRDRAWKDDEDHPTPVLRVFIFAEILRVLHEIDPTRYPLQNTPKEPDKLTLTDKLDQDWSEILTLWRYDYMGKPADDADSQYRPERICIHANSSLHVESFVHVNRVMQTIRPILREFATCLLNQAEFGDTEFGSTEKKDSNGRQHLSMKIPWTDKIVTTTGPYNDVMASMTDRDFARQKVASQLIFDPAIDIGQVDLVNPEETLQDYLNHWDDSGPTGSSGGTHLLSFFSSGVAF